MKVGERVGSRWIVEDGLQPGSRVVVEGAPARDGIIVHATPFTPGRQRRRGSLAARIN